MRVLKFGGSSVASPDSIKQVCAIIRNELKDSRLAVVLSAFGGITNQLIACGEKAAAGDSSYRDECQQVRDRHIQATLELIPKDSQEEVQNQLKIMLSDLEEMCYGAYLVRELSGRSKDHIVGYGERLSSYIISEYLKSEGVNVAFCKSWELIKTDDNFTKAAVDIASTAKNIQGACADNIDLFIVPGFVGSTDDGQLTTLGRGGSDYTASLFAYSLDAKAMEKWTDVEGMLTADPRVVDNATQIDTMSYQEAMELCHFGAKVIYPPTIQPLLEKNIPIYVRSTFHPDHPGTIINGKYSDLPAGRQETKGNIKGLSSIDGIALLSLSGGGMVGVPGFSKRLFSALASGNVNVILITQASSEHTITVGIQSTDADKAVELLEEEFGYDLQRGIVDPIDVEKDKSIIAIVGDNMRYQAGLSGKAFFELGKNNVNIRAIAQGSSERNISVVIESKDVQKALNSLHQSFFEAQVKRLNLFLVGVGNVGGTLIQQIADQQDTLRDHHNIELRVVGIANSKKAAFDVAGLDLSTWKDHLQGGREMTTREYCSHMVELNLSNSVFVDNTASEVVAAEYADILKESISVIASNKIAASSDQKEYELLKSLALKHSTDFKYETNVGAGLPVIDTIQNLVKSGDKINEIHAVLSGSLNFIFNNFTADSSFQEVVKQAMAEGYTEPDPRIDLSGKDVMRKILILARDAGYELDMEQIEGRAFLSEEVFNLPSVEDFVAGLTDVESDMQSRREAAESKGAKLKVVASFQNGEASVGLQEIPGDHPFYHLEGKDNIVMLYSERYKEQPLVIKGAGAGAEVTAMGVFADIISIANQ